MVIAFGAIAPTLRWQEFTGGMENFNVATAIETVRDGHWLLPYLQGEPRTKKPPLTQWITALGLMSSRSRAWGARWPSLLMACLTLAAVYELGRIVGGRRLAMLSALICGSSFIFLKYAHVASYDVHLMLWVTVCHLFLAYAFFRDHWLTGCAGAGVALGLALMTKGPLAILETIVPAVGFILWRKLKKQPIQWKTTRPQRLIAMTFGVGIALAISLPWTLWVMGKVAGLPQQWTGEVILSVESRFERRFGWHSYLVLFPEMFPWMLWFAAAMWIAIRSRRINPRVQYLLFWLLLPIVAMTFFPERRDRYLLPMIGPTAVLSGWAMLWLRRRVQGAEGALCVVQWGALAIIAVIVPLAGATRILSAGGIPWFSPVFAVIAAVIGASLVMLGLWQGRGSPAWLVTISAAIMLAGHGLEQYGYAKSPQGRSAAKSLVERVVRRQPQARIWNANSRGLPLEFAIYLDHVVPTVKDPATIASNGRPVIVFVRDLEMHAAPAGFHLLDSSIINKERWNAFIRER